MDWFEWLYTAGMPPTLCEHDDSYHKAADELCGAWLKLDQLEGVAFQQALGAINEDPR
jgi:hypothetical protein